MNNLCLGLDVGTNSVGYAVVDMSDSTHPIIVTAGSKLFSSASKTIESEISSKVKKTSEELW